MNWPTVAVVIITYNRPQEVRQVIKALRTCIQYKGPLVWHLADDQSPGLYVQAIREDFPELHFSASITARGGWGKNVNTALKGCKTPYVFACEDDYVAIRPLNLTQGVALLEKEHTLGLVRYDGLAGHILNLQLRTTVTSIGDVAYVKIEHTSPHINIYSHRPHLKGERFHRHYGYYPEGLALGATEETYAHHVKDNMGTGPQLVALTDGLVRAFTHIGHSWKGSPYDK